MEFINQEAFLSLSAKECSDSKLPKPGVFNYTLSYYSRSIDVFWSHRIKYIFIRNKILHAYVRFNTWL